MPDNDFLLNSINQYVEKYEVTDEKINLKMGSGLDLLILDLNELKNYFPNGITEDVLNCHPDIRDKLLLEQKEYSNNFDIWISYINNDHEKVENLKNRRIELYSEYFVNSPTVLDPYFENFLTLRRTGKSSSEEAVDVILALPEVNYLLSTDKYFEGMDSEVIKDRYVSRFNSLYSKLENLEAELKNFEKERYLAYASLIPENVKEHSIDPNMLRDKGFSYILEHDYYGKLRNLANTEDKYHECIESGGEWDITLCNCKFKCPDGLIYEKISNSCLCPDGTLPDNQGKCCTQSEFLNSNGECESKCDEATQIWDDTKEECVDKLCPDGSIPESDGSCPVKECEGGLVYDSITDSCVCPDGRTPDKQGNCCTQSEFLNSNGECESKCDEATQMWDDTKEECVDKLCPDGSIPESDGSCPDRECEGSLVYDSTSDSCVCPDGRTPDKQGKCCTQSEFLTLKCQVRKARI